MPATDIERLRRTWQGLGRTDPLWAVLSAPDRRHGGWDPVEFMRTGEEEIAAVMSRVEALAPGLARTRALDFGCGPGRLTAALASRFGTVAGVDVSAAMIDLARANCARLNVELVINERSDLARFEDGRFDLVYSARVLQHMRRALIESYLAEFIRVLAPGGLAVFQVTAARKPRSPLDPGPRVLNALPARAREWRQAGLVRRGKRPYEMHGIRRRRVERLLARAGAELLAVEPDSTPRQHWESFTYFARC